MSIKSLRYWVFTSGENGIHGLDWGIKHVSEYFSDRQKLDTDYRALLKNFGLPPSLERPADEVGLILLSWDKSDYIAGFIFPGIDHGDRPNTSSVICMLPSELAGKKSVNETLKDIWEKNNIADIASKNSQHRPDTLRLEGDSLVAENAPYFRSPVSWPSCNNGWLQIDGKQRELSRVNALKAPVIRKEIKTSSGSKLKIVIALVAVAVTFSAMKYFSSGSSENNTEPLRQEDIPEVSNDIPKPNNHSDSQDVSGTSEDSLTISEDSRQAEIIELREKLTQFLADVKGKPVLDGKNLTVRLRNWNKEKESLFGEIQSKINRISLKTKKPSYGMSVEVIFSLPSHVSGDIDKVIDAFLSQL